MAEPRKVFRIEQMAAARLEDHAEGAQAGLRHAEIMGELHALRDALSALPSQPSGARAALESNGVARLASELNRIAGAIKSADGYIDARGGDGRRASRPKEPASRIEQELGAVVSGTEQATQKILAAAEAIDSTANTLSAALNGRMEQELVQDIQDLVIEIFEACNFQDLIGQRVGKVLATVNFVQDHIARMLAEIQTASTVAAPLHGPRLDGDRGHASQQDIDALFATARRARGE